MNEQTTKAVKLLDDLLISSELSRTDLASSLRSQAEDKLATSDSFTISVMMTFYDNVDWYELARLAIMLNSPF